MSTAIGIVALFGTCLCFVVNLSIDDKDKQDKNALKAALFLIAAAICFK